MDSRKEINRLVGANVKRERERVGYTQDRFSELLGIGAKSLSAIERGVVGVSLPLLLKICEVLHVSPNVILLAQTRKNDTTGILSQLEHLSPAQFAAASEVIAALMKALSPHE